MNKQNQQKSKKQSSKLTTQPYKGARDFYPEDMRIRNYIFDTWKTVCKRYGFEEYDFPFLEPLEIYEAKSGEELVNKQIYNLNDRGGRRLAIRPEKTPSVARLVAGKIKQLPRPIKWFNIGNCWRFEKPQKGRGREFFQLDCDIFGLENVIADAEVFSIPVEIMLELGAKEKMFEVRVNNRRFTEFYLREVVKLDGGTAKRNTQMYAVIKTIDSKPKISEDEFTQLLEEARLKPDQIDKLDKLLEADLKFVEKYKGENKGAGELIQFFELVAQKGFSAFFKFSPEIMRGLDYYTGNVMEQFDLDPENNRSMYGGGRYDDLASLYVDEKIPGVGFAMGDVTLLEFLKGWKLLPTLSTETKVYITIFDKNTQEKSSQIAQELRKAGINTTSALEIQKLDKQLKYADRKGIPYVIIAGPSEIKKGVVILKDMKAKKQEEMRIEEVVNKLS